MRKRGKISLVIVSLVGACVLTTISAAQSIQPLYGELFRPQFHYSPPGWWMNDPNGLVYFQGEYHLFYQHNPEAVVWGPMHWGHAISADLIHWKTLPIALFPDELGTIFSGTVVVDEDNTSGLVPGGGLVAVYSYNTQTQGAAYSTDHGRTWSKYQGNPILPALQHDFRDPKVFWHDGHWIMVISGGRSVIFMTSPNLLAWELIGKFDSGYQGGTWECPDVFPLTIDGVTKWVLIVSVNPTAPAGGSGTRCFIGSFDGRAFTDEYPTKSLWLDWGADNYAGITWNNMPDGRRVLIGWMNNWAYANGIPTSVWRGAMTFPRELSLINTPSGVRLAQRPIDEIHSLRTLHETWQNVTVDGTITFETPPGQPLEIDATFELGDAVVFGFECFQTDSDALRIAYHVGAQQITITRPGAAIRAFNPIFSAPLMPIDDRIRLRLLVDRSSVEVFANDGLLAMTSQVFSESTAARVQVFTQANSVRLVSMAVYRLQSIWKSG